MCAFCRHSAGLSVRTHSWLGVPMVVQGRVIGVISIQSLEQERAFDQEQVDLLTLWPAKRPGD